MHEEHQQHSQSRRPSAMTILLESCPGEHCDYRRTTPSERRLLIFLAIALVLTIALVIALGVVSYHCKYLLHSRYDTGIRLCDSPECVRSGREECYFDISNEKTFIGKLRTKKETKTVKVLSEEILEEIDWKEWDMYCGWSKGGLHGRFWREDQSKEEKLEEGN
ncbi:hypothetical protein C0J52_02842 [Blattella germanica]|nr:hypothetical protein C0J52_02842 [Blattella germanica]